MKTVVSEKHRQVCNPKQTLPEDFKLRIIIICNKFKDLPMIKMYESFKSQILQNQFLSLSTRSYLLPMDRMIPPPMSPDTMEVPVDKDILGPPPPNHMPPPPH